MNSLGMYMYEQLFEKNPDTRPIAEIAKELREREQNSAEKPKPEPEN